jgi:hypothetical protein
LALSAFDDKSHPPDPAELREMLGAAAELWDAAISETTAHHAPIEPRWNFSGAKYGWSLRLVRGERIVLYMTPQAGQFLASIVLGEKAAAAAHERALPQSVLARIDAAPRYAEGRGIRFEVTTAEDVCTVRHLVALKLA